jgi:NhaA family Na+:H+ antiporter
VKTKRTSILAPIQAFVSTESASGIVLLCATIVALAWANSPWSESYFHLLHSPVSLGIGRFSRAMSLEHWINDGLMTVFFLMVGLEIKRELVTGELSSPRRAAFPISAAIGGMVVPAAIYAAFNPSGSGSRGWGIPMATDIAFAVGVLTLVGRAVPTSVRVFLLALAIVDDLGAVLVIAIFYTSKLSMPALAIAGAILVALVLLNVFRVRRPLPYLLLGVGLWAATLNSGIHATIAGVLLAFTIPCSHRNAQDIAQSPLARIEHALLKPVAFFIIPIFALANAGVDLRSAGSAAFASPIMWGVLFGLIIGKPIGVVLASWIALRSGIASLPENSTRRQILGVAFLCGIGFTMSLFVANLAFPGMPEPVADAKIGILLASVISGCLGAAVLRSGKSAKRMADPS